MMNVSSSNSAVQMVSQEASLKCATWEELKDVESGYVFTDDYLASTWDDIDVNPKSLPMGTAVKGMRKITSPVLLLKSHRSKMAFIMASESTPVYVCSSSKRSKTDGYTMLFSLMPNVFPEYFFYMSKYKTWEDVSQDIDFHKKFEYGLEYGYVPEWGSWCFDVFTNTEIVEYPETVFLNHTKGFRLPLLPVQRQQIDDAKFMEKYHSDKMAQVERRAQQKEWLNEEHIRNSKHRLSNDVMPVRMAAERLEKFISTSSEGVKSHSIIGKSSQGTVGDLLKNLILAIHKIEDDIEKLTESEIIGQNPEVLDAGKFIGEYCNRFATSYNRDFSFKVESMNGNLNIKISRVDFEELLEQIFSNAVRHGFTDDSRNDYKIVVTLSETKDKYCRIDIANNGNPISERGRKEYFVRGSFAGETGHTGLGGNRVFQICEKANGRANEPYCTEEFPVVISVEFPIV